MKPLDGVELARQGERVTVRYDRGGIAWELTLPLDRRRAGDYSAVARTIYQHDRDEQRKLADEDRDQDARKWLQWLTQLDADGEHDADSDAVDHGFVLLDDIEEEPLTPDAILPGLLWEGRTSVIYGSGKIGKSHLISQALACMVTGELFLDEEVKSQVIGIASEMTTGQVKAYIRRHGVREGSGAPIHVKRCPSIRDVLAFIESVSPAAMIVDTLTQFAATERTDLNDPVAVRTLVETVRSRNTPLLMVHHTKKSDGTLRDSGDIVNVADMVIRVQAVDETGTVIIDDNDGFRAPRRRMSYRGRWEILDKTIVFERELGAYRLIADRNASIVAEKESERDAILAIVCAQPGITQTGVYNKLQEIGTKRRKGDIFSTVGRMVDIGDLRVEEGTRNKRMLYVRE